jgi:hypothetical protein
VESSLLARLSGNSLAEGGEGNLEGSGFDRLALEEPHKAVLLS